VTAGVAVPLLGEAGRLDVRSALAGGIRDEGCGIVFASGLIDLVLLTVTVSTFVVVVVVVVVTVPSSLIFSTVIDSVSASSFFFFSYSSKSFSMSASSLVGMYWDWSLLEKR